MSVESSIGIACGCLPGCKPLMNKLFPRYFGTINNSSNQYPRRWQHNHAKQTDEEASTQLSKPLWGESIELASPMSAKSGTVVEHAALQLSASRQTHNRFVNVSSTQTTSLSHSPSRSPQSIFTTTITAQPHLSRSSSRHNMRWSSMDNNKPLPMRPAPSATAVRRPSGKGYQRSRGTSRDLGTFSSASTEMFILQGRESRSGKQSPVLKNDVWMG